MKKKNNTKINENKSLFFEKTNTIGKPLTVLTKKKRERASINKIKNKRREIITEAKEIQKTVRKCYEELYANKLENLDEMDKLVETYNLPKPNQEESEYINK